MKSSNSGSERALVNLESSDRSALALGLVSALIIVIGMAALVALGYWWGS